MWTEGILPTKKILTLANWENFSLMKLLHVSSEEHLDKYNATTCVIDVPLQHLLNRIVCIDSEPMALVHHKTSNILTEGESCLDIPILFHLRFWEVSRIAISISSFFFFWLGWVDFNQVRFAWSGLERKSTYLLCWINFLVVYLSESIYLVLVEIFVVEFTLVVFGRQHLDLDLNLHLNLDLKSINLKCLD